MGIANRTDFDLGSHTDASGTKLQYFDQAANERYTPYVIEPSFGLTRSMMAFLVDAYTEDEAPNTKGGVDVRTVLKLDPRLAPVKAAVLPLSKSEDLVPRAESLAARLRKHWNVDMDVSQAIGRRYRRQDEIGTPVLHHRRLRDAGRSVRDHPGARHDGAGAGGPRPGRVVSRVSPDRRLIPRPPPALISAGRRTARGDGRADDAGCMSAEPAHPVVDNTAAHLLHHRTLLLDRELDQDNGARLWSQLILLAAEDPPRTDITLLISSPGGWCPRCSRSAI